MTILNNAFKRTRILDQCGSSVDWAVDGNIFDDILSGGIDNDHRDSGNENLDFEFIDPDNRDYTINLAAVNDRAAVPAVQVVRVQIDDDTAPCELDIVLRPFRSELPGGHVMDHGPISTHDRTRIDVRYNGESPQTVTDSELNGNTISLRMQTCPNGSDRVTFDADHGWCQDSAFIGGSAMNINGRCVAVRGQRVANNVTDDTPRSPPPSTGVTFKACTTTANTSTGSQSLTCSDFTSVPKFAWLIYSPAATGSTSNDAVLSYGMSDCTNQWGIGVRALDSQGNTDNRSWSDNNSILVGASGNATPAYKAALTSCVAGGVDIDWSVAPAAAGQITALFITGSEFSAQVGVANTVSTGPTTVALPFSPTMVFMTRTGSAMNTDGTRRDAMINLGVATRAGLQRALSFGAYNTQDTEDVNAGIWSDRSLHRIDNTGGDRAIRLLLGSNQFTASMISNTINQWSYAAFATTDGASWVSDRTTPTMAFTDPISDMEFAPGLVVQAGTLIDTALGMGSASINADDTENAGGFALSITTPDGTFTSGISVEDASGTSNALSYAASGLQVRGQDGRSLYRVTVSQTASGFENDFSSVAGASHRWLSFALGGVP